MNLPAEKISAWLYANFECKPRKNGSEIRICSPFDGDKKFRFNISVDKAVCHDWRGDGWSGGDKPTFIKFVQVYRNLSYREAVNEVIGVELAGQYLADLKNSKNDNIKKPEQKFKLPDLACDLLDSPHKTISKTVIGWLNSRGISDKIIEDHRMMHSIYDVVWLYFEYDELVYWQTRNIFDKIFNFPDESVGVTKGQFIYGFDNVEPSSYISVFESIINSQTINQNSVATGGAHMTKTQLSKIRALNPTKGVILAADNDKAGWESVLKNYNLISPYYKVYVSIPSISCCNDWNDVRKIKSDSDTIGLFENSIKPFSHTWVIDKINSFSNKSGQFLDD